MRILERERLNFNFNPAQEKHKTLSNLSKEAHLIPEKISQNRKRIEEIYLEVLKESESQPANDLTKWT